MGKSRRSAFNWQPNRGDIVRERSRGATAFANASVVERPRNVPNAEEQEVALDAMIRLDELALDDARLLELSAAHGRYDGLLQWLGETPAKVPLSVRYRMYTDAVTITFMVDQIICGDMKLEGNALEFLEPSQPTGDSPDWLVGDIACLMYADEDMSELLSVLVRYLGEIDKVGPDLREVGSSMDDWVARYRLSPNSYRLIRLNRDLADQVRPFFVESLEHYMLFDSRYVMPDKPDEFLEQARNGIRVPSTALTQDALRMAVFRVVNDKNVLAYATLEHLRPLMLVGRY